MAELKTQTDAAQPTQQTTEQPAEKIQATVPADAQTEEPKQTAIERARLNDKREEITLDAEQAYQALEQFGDTPGEYSSTSSVQGIFWRFRFRGAVVTVSPAFKEAFDKGEILSVTATPTVGETMRPDPNNAGMKRPEIVLGWSLTYSGADKMEKAMNAKKLAATLKTKAKLQEMVEEQKIKAVLAKITPEKLTSLVTDEEVDAMLAAI